MVNRCAPKNIVESYKTMLEYMKERDVAGIHTFNGLVVVNARAILKKYSKSPFDTFLGTAVHEWLHEIYPKKTEAQIDKFAPKYLLTWFYELEEEAN